MDLPDLIHGRYGHCLVYLPLARGGGHLYAIGGLAGSPEEYSRSTECLAYDSDESPSQDASWKELRPLNVGRAYFGAVVHRCGILIAGGLGANGSPLSTVEVFRRLNVNGRGQWSLLSSRMNEATPVTGLVLGSIGIVSFGKFNGWKLVRFLQDTNHLSEIRKADLTYKRTGKLCLVANEDMCKDLLLYCVDRQKWLRGTIQTSKSLQRK